MTGYVFDIESGDRYGRKGNFFREGQFREVVQHLTVSRIVKHLAGHLGRNSMHGSVHLRHEGGSRARHMMALWAEGG